MKLNTQSFAIIALACAACGGGDAGVSDAATSPPTYVPSANAPAATAERQVFDDYRDYRLAMPAVQRWYEAQSNVYRAIRDNPELVDELEAFADASDVDELEAHFDGIPEWRDAVDEAGLDMREYVTILMSLFHARSIDAAVQSGADRAQAIASGQVDASNLAFVEQNRSELDRLERELGALGESMQ